MSKKLTLNEDAQIMIIPADQMPQQQAPQQMAMPEQKPTKDSDILSVSNLINKMIKGEWDAIDLYNSVAATLESQGCNNGQVIATIKDIVKEEYVHVGQLQKVLQYINADAAEINNGSQEAENDAALDAGKKLTLGEFPVAEDLNSKMHSYQSHTGSGIGTHLISYTKPGTESNPKSKGPGRYKVSPKEKDKIQQSNKKVFDKIKAKDDAYDADVISKAYDLFAKDREHEREREEQKKIKKLTLPEVK